MITTNLSKVFNTSDIDYKLRVALGNVAYTASKDLGGGVYSPLKVFDKNYGDRVEVNGKTYYHVHSWEIACIFYQSGVHAPWDDEDFERYAYMGGAMPRLDEFLESAIFVNFHEALFVRLVNKECDKDGLAAINPNTLSKVQESVSNRKNFRKYFAE